jgi:hypothetical protein
VGVHGKHPTLGCACVFALLAGFLILQATKKVPFEFQRSRVTYILMFSDRAYAEKVAALNGVWVKTVGRPVYR